MSVVTSCDRGRHEHEVSNTFFFVGGGGHRRNSGAGGSGVILLKVPHPSVISCDTATISPAPDPAIEHSIPVNARLYEVVWANSPTVVVDISM